MKLFVVVIDRKNNTHCNLIDVGARFLAEGWEEAVAMCGSVDNIRRANLVRTNGKTLMTLR